MGQTLETLVEGRKRGKWQGRTRTDKLVFFAADAAAAAEGGNDGNAGDSGNADCGDYRGQLVNVKITQAGPWSLQGTPVAAAGR